MPADLTEDAFESAIVSHLCTANGYEQGSPRDYDKSTALDTVRLFRFLESSQPGKMIHDRRNFAEALSSALNAGGVISLLRKGFTYNHEDFDLYNLPAMPPGFSVTRQLCYSQENANRLDLCIFLNGIPVITIELKNSQSGQDVNDAVNQYRRDRSPGDMLFMFRRCLVHFAADCEKVSMCTELKGKVNRGSNGGAGNPPVSYGYRTAYLWEDVLTRGSLSDIIENYALSDEKRQVFPRWHQLNVVRSLAGDVMRDGIGRRYLVQHSAGSGKSYSIAWLACRMAGLEEIDGVVIVTDRRQLDQQISGTVHDFAQLKTIAERAEDSAGLDRLMRQGKKIIITTVHKFHYVLEKMNGAYQGKKYAVIIDEAHSSQNGELASDMRKVIAGAVCMDSEDVINALAGSRMMPGNASFFAFTATPKGLTLETFGKKITGDDGAVKFVPHYVYSMRQAIEEGFILDVLKYYTPVKTYFTIAKKLEGNPLFRRKSAQRLLKSFAEGHEKAVRTKAKIIAEHFLAEVIGRRKIGGQARAMIVTDGIKRALQYYDAVSSVLADRGAEFRAIVAFSGTADYHGQEMTERDKGCADVIALEQDARGQDGYIHT